VDEVIFGFLKNYQSSKHKNISTGVVKKIFQSRVIPRGGGTWGST
jgi:hypothetical protein